MSTKLYVANLTAGATDADLSELFGRFGAVASAAVVIDKNTGRSRGFALVEMDDGADAAVRGTNGRVFHGRPMMVSVVVPPIRPPAQPVVRRV